MNNQNRPHIHPLTKIGGLSMKKKRKFLSWVLAFCLTLICFSIADFTASAATENMSIISGQTYRLVNVGSGLYLNVKSGSDTNGANINQFTGDNSITEDFVIRWIASENCYKIYAACSSEGNDRVLSVDYSGTSVAANSNVHLWQEASTKAQGLQIVSAGTADEYYIQPISNPSVYLTANGDSTGSANTGANAAGNVVMKSAQSNTDYQKWILICKNDYPPNGVFYIRNKYSGKYLTVSGTQVVQHSKYASTNQNRNAQKWVLISRGNNYYNFQLASDYYSYMDVDNATDADGTNIKMHGSQIDEYGAQHFRFEVSGDRCYTIRPMCSSTRVLSLPSNTATENAQIKLATKNTSLDRQQWYFERVTTDPYAEMGWEYVFANPYTTPYRYLSSTFWEDNYHSGIDIIEYDGGIAGAPILAPVRAYVEAGRYENPNGSEAGYNVVLRTQITDPTENKLLRIGFYHLEDKPKVALNTWVDAGTIIGYVGNTGSASTGNHLHLFVTRDGSIGRDSNTTSSDLVDPVRFFPNVEFYYHD